MTGATPGLNPHLRQYSVKINALAAVNTITPIFTTEPISGRFIVTACILTMADFPAPTGTTTVNAIVKIGTNGTTLDNVCASLTADLADTAGNYVVVANGATVSLGVPPSTAVKVKLTTVATVATVQWLHVTVVGYYQLDATGADGADLLPA